MSDRLSRALAVCLSTMLACAPNLRVVHPPIRRCAPPAPTTSAAPAPAHGMFLVVGADWDASRLALTGDPGTAPQRWIISGWRAELRDGRLEFAGPPIVGAVEAVLPRGSGWRFVTDATILDADSYLGPLTQRDRFAAGRPGRGTGRHVRLRDGRLIGARPPADGYVLDAAFADDDRGVAVVEPGLAFRTEDGGAHWEPVAGGPFAGALAAPTRRWLAGREECVEIDDGGRAAPVACAALPMFVPQDHSRERHPVGRLPTRELSARRYGSARYVDPNRALLDADTRLQDSPVRVDLATGDLIPEPSSVKPCTQPELILGVRPHAVCAVTPQGPVPDMRERMELVGRDARGSWHPVLRFVRGASSPYERCSVRDDGRAVACRGACDARYVTEAVADTSFCVRCGDGPPTEHRVDGPADRVAILGWRGGRPLFARLDEPLPRATLIDADGTVRPLLGDCPASLRTGTVFMPYSQEDLRVGRDGRVRLLIHEARGHAAVAVVEGVPGDAFVARALPPWWAAAGAAHATRHLAVCGAEGIVVAASAAHGYWVSERADAPWRPLFAGGDAALLEWLRDPLRDADRVDCDELGVHVPGVGRTLGWGPLRARVLGAANLLPTPRRAETSPRPRSPSWDCDPRDAVPVPPPAPSHSVPDAEVTALPGIDRLSWLTAPPRAADGPATLWSYLGATLAQPNATPRTVPWLALPVLRDALGFVALVPDDAQGTTFLTLVPRSERVVLELFDQRGTGPLRSRWHREVRGSLRSEGRQTYATLDGIRHDLIGRGYFGRVVAAWEGARVAASVSLPFWEEGHSRHVLLLTTTPGGPVRSTSFEFADGPPFGAFVLPDAAGLVHEDRDGVLWGFGGNGARRRLASGLRWTACGPDARGVVVLLTYVHIPGGFDDMNSLHGVRAEFGVEGGALCLRRMVTADFVLDPAGGTVRAVGYVPRARQWMRLACELR